MGDNLADDWEDVLGRKSGLNWNPPPLKTDGFEKALGLDSGLSWKPPELCSGESGNRSKLSETEELGLGG